MNTRRPSRNAKIRPLESLDERIVPSGGGSSLAPDVAAALVTARGGAELGSIFRQYLAYEKSGGAGAFNPPESRLIHLRGASVGVAVRFDSGDFSTLVGSLRGIGMHVTAIDSRNHLVEGYLPISKLPTVVTNSHEASTTPVRKSATSGTPIVPPTSPAPQLSGQSPATSPLTKASGALSIIAQEYAAYVNAGSHGAFVSSQSRVSIRGDMVGVDIRVTEGSLDLVAGQLKGIGMKVSAVNSTYRIVEGLLPISRLAMVNNNSHVVSLLAVYRPVLG